MPRANDNALLKLYKYRSLADEFGRKTVEDVIIHNRLFWKSPADFNDPFDCAPVLVFGTSEASRQAYAKRSVARRNPELSRAERGKKVRELLRRSPRKQAEDMSRGFRDWMSETACTCFSEVPNCPLMWAHYANSHRGVCFIFQELAGSITWFAFDVTYSEERPHIDYTGDPEVLIKQGMLNKSSDWAYEQEHRMFEYRRGAGYRTFPPIALLGVIYGARISDDDRNYVDELVARRGSIRRYQARVDDHMFKLNVDPI